MHKLILYVVIYLCISAAGAVAMVMMMTQVHVAGGESSGQRSDGLTGPPATGRVVSDLIQMINDQVQQRLQDDKPAGCPLPDTIRPSNEASQPEPPQDITSFLDELQENGPPQGDQGRGPRARRRSHRETSGPQMLQNPYAS